MFTFETKKTLGKRLVRELLEKKIAALKRISVGRPPEWAGWAEIDTYETRIKEDTYYGR